MARRWGTGTLTAVVVAIATALTVAGVMGQSHWQFALSLTAYGVELSAASEGVRVVLTL